MGLRKIGCRPVGYLGNLFDTIILKENEVFFFQAQIFRDKVFQIDIASSIY